MQSRVARLLTSDRYKQETIMNEFGWAWRQVQPLKEVFDKNVSLLFDSTKCFLMTCLSFLDRANSKQKSRQR